MVYVRLVILFRTLQGLCLHLDKHEFYDKISKNEEQISLVRNPKLATVWLSNHGVKGEEECYYHNWRRYKY